MLLNIITPCIRKQNLQEILKSLRPDLTPIRWIIILDQKDLTSQDQELLQKLQTSSPCSIEMLAKYQRGSVSGNAQRNLAIDLLKEGYVYFLDDDNIMHPSFWKHYTQVSPTGLAFIGHQLLKNGKLRKGVPRYVKRHHIDSAQFCMPLIFIGKNRWIHDAYTADSDLVSFIYQTKFEQFTFVNEVTSYYNYLGN